MYIVPSKDGTKIAYDKLGQGPALIIVAGAFSYRKFPWLVRMAKLLSVHFTVYNYDRRGRGDSGDTKPYAIDREIEDLHALINDAGGSAYVWGLSCGASLVLQAAASGLNITKLALHEPPFVVKSTDRKPPQNFAAHVTRLIAENRRSEAVKYFITKVIGAPVIAVAILRLLPWLWSKLIAVAHTLPYDAALLDGYMDGKPLRAESWRNVTMPTLLLEGTESPALLQHCTRELLGVLPNARLVSKKGLGHRRPASKKIAPELVKFFTKSEAGGR